MKKFPHVGLRVAIVAAVQSVAALHAFGDEPFTSPKIWLGDGLHTGSIHLAPQSIGAFPLLSPPVNGFSATVAVTLTDRQVSNNKQDFYTVRQTSIVGNALPSGGYTYLATLDSGAQSHILSDADTAATGILDSNRQGSFSIDTQGANGVESLDISDPLGVFVSSAKNVTVANGKVTAPPNTFTGQYNTSVLTAEVGSQLPSVIGSPIFAQYAINIHNSQTRRIVKPDGVAIRTPDVQFVAHGAADQLQFKLSIRMQDPNGAATAAPAFLPSFENTANLGDDPGSPTFWSFPFANVNVQGNGVSLVQQPFLFDTGAQITVLSEETADQMGFDAATDTPDFTIDVLGVGGIQQAKGFFLETLSLPVTGGDATFHDVPVIVLDVVDPRTGSGVIPGVLGMNLFNDRDLSIDLNSTGFSTVRFSAPITAEWNLNANGTWLPDSNWKLGVPDGEDLAANFLGVATAARTVTVDGDYTIGTMKFDNVNSYTVTGSGKLTFISLGRPSKIEVISGSHTVAAPMAFDERMNVSVAAACTLTLSGDTTSPEAAVTKSGTGQLRVRNARYESLAIDSGSVQLMTGMTQTSRLETLSIAVGASLDLTNAKLAIDYEGPSPLEAIRASLAAGRIVSSNANASTAVGYAEASAINVIAFGDIAVDTTALLLRLTLKGDANLTGNVNFDDLVPLAQHYNQSGQTWTGGDFDYNGIVNFDDLVAVAQNYNKSLPANAASLGITSAFTSDWALARALVPEPTSLVAMAGLAGLRRRRRRS